jgi:hypothetical protein
MARPLTLTPAALPTSAWRQACRSGLEAMARALVHASAWGLIAAALCATLPTLAMGPREPFTPPAVLAASAPAVAASAPVAAAGFGLAGVRMGSRPAALIDGRWVPLGHSVRGARLAQLSPQAVVLQHPNGRRERLSMSFAPAATAPSPTDAASSPQE